MRLAARVNAHVPADGVPMGRAVRARVADVVQAGSGTGGPRAGRAVLY